MRERWEVTLNEVIEDFCIDAQYLRGLSATTVTGERNTALKFCRFMEATYPYIEIRNITIEHVNRWIVALGESGISQNSVNCYAIRIRALFKYLNDKGINSTNWQDIPVPKRQDSKRKYFTPEEVSELIQKTRSKRTKAIIAVLYTSGVRVSELCALDTEDLRNCTIQLVGKNMKARTTFIDPFANALVTSYLKGRKKSSPVLFPSRSNSRMNGWMVNKCLKTAAKDAGWGDRPISAHMFRHSFATTLVNSGANVAAVQLLMGHQKIETTSIYLHMATDHLKRAHEKHMQLMY